MSGTKKLENLLSWKIGKEGSLDPERLAASIWDSARNRVPLESALERRGREVVYDSEMPVDKVLNKRESG